MRTACATAIVLWLISSANAQTDITRGWWIVVAAIEHVEGSSLNDRKMKAVSKRMRGCGLVTFNDLSMKFIGFDPGYDVVVTGPYPERSDAVRYLTKARNCAPSSYIKEGEYSGE